MNDINSILQKLQERKPKFKIGDVVYLAAGGKAAINKIMGGPFFNEYYECVWGNDKTSQIQIAEFHESILFSESQTSNEAAGEQAKELLQKKHP
ncbi:hypothetical protein DCC81_23995 [Chitinophaga parva]|uniref:DUF2158 domain-containing protein n=1 Tax=Chitinophaga parva TaxID=2169414 RepID=A0A2T7BEC6_9BACT|nr:hypothetical protein [Chitinophaga parva]PUZ23444.1 hypothetical protein DCC81_23995 [Chitinophaga parva]